MANQNRKNEYTLCIIGKIDVFVHLVDDNVGRPSKLDQVLSMLEDLKVQGEKIMAVADDIKAALAALDTETTAIGANIAALVTKIKNSMTDAEVSEVKASFATLTTRLTSLAVDPTVPVPPPTPELAALRGRA